jgi:transposase
MHQSNTLYVGLDVHKESIAVASIAKEPHAEVVSLGHIGTRPCDLDQLVRQLQSTRQHRVFVYAAGPCGYGFYRSLTKQGPVCWGVALSFIPPKTRRSGQNQPLRRHHTRPPEALGGPHAGLGAPGGR